MKCNFHFADSTSGELGEVEKMLGLPCEHYKITDKECHSSFKST